MKILVLGGNGFIGSHLIDRLLAEGHQVRVFDKYEEHFRNPLPLVEYCLGDFGNRGLLADALQGIEIVYHLISTTLPKSSNDDPVFDITSNVVETLFLLEECVRCGVNKVIYTSSGGTVYGVPTVLPIREDAPTYPECSYGITKLTVEKYLALYNHLFGLDYAIVRPSNPYGSRQNPKNIQGAISVFLDKALREEPIVIWGDGEIVRDYIYIDDLIDAMWRMMTASSSTQIFNVGSGMGYSLNNIIDIIKKVTNKEVTVRYLDKRLFDIPKIYLDIEKIKRELFWEPKIGIEAGICETWEFIKNGTIRSRF